MKALLAYSLGPGSAVPRLAAALARRTIETGGLASSVLRSEESAIYLLVFPRVDDHPRLLRRWPEIHDGLRAHLANAWRSIESTPNPPRQMLTLIVLLQPNAEGSSMHVAYHENQVEWLPGALLTKEEGEGANLHHVNATFRLNDVGAGMSHANDR